MRQGGDRPSRWGKGRPGVKGAPRGPKFASRTGRAGAMLGPCWGRVGDAHRGAAVIVALALSCGFAPSEGSDPLVGSAVESGVLRSTLRFPAPIVALAQMRLPV